MLNKSYYKVAFIFVFLTHCLFAQQEKEATITPQERKVGLIVIGSIVGIYGMNFNSEASFFNMPELNWEWGYVMVWVVMISVVAVMLIYFKRKKWL